MIKLLPTDASGATWLYFEDAAGNSASICLNNIANEIAGTIGHAMRSTLAEERVTVASLNDGEINDITMTALGKWPSFEAQSWACRVVHACGWKTLGCESAEEYKEFQAWLKAGKPLAPLDEELTLPTTEMNVGMMIADVIDELERARAKFPSSTLSMLALTEEVGELAKALLDEPLEWVYAEAVQVATMAFRVALEGDDTIDGFRLAKGLDAIKRD